MSNKFLTWVASFGILAATVLPAAVLAADSIPPSVTSVSPTAATAGTPVTLSTTYTENAGGAGISHCYLEVNSVSLPNNMTLSGSSYYGSASQSYTFGAAGTYQVRAICMDLASQAGFGPMASVVVYASGNGGSDVTPPNTGMVWPSSATQNVPTYFYVNASDNVGVTGCTLFYDGYTQGAMTLQNGSWSLVITPSTQGTHTAYAQCRDAVNNYTTGNATTVYVSPASSVDTQAPTVGSISPVSVSPNANTTLYTTYTDNVGVTQCDLYLNGAFNNTMSLNNGTASVAVYFGASGSYSAYARCRDAAGNYTNGSTVSVNVNGASSDTTVPSVGTVWTLNAGNNQTAYYVNATDNMGVTDCSLYVDGNYVGAMTMNGTTWSLASSAYAAGTHTAYARCRDAANNNSTGAVTNVTVYASGSGDTTAPTVSATWPYAATAGVPQSYSVSFSDNVSVTQCELYVSGVYAATMSGSGASGNASATYTFPSSGSYQMRARCADAAGNVTFGQTTTVAVTGSGSTNYDTTAPTVNLVNAVSPQQNVPVTITTTYGDNANIVTSCTLYVDGANWGAMNLSQQALSGSASKDFAFNPSGTHTVYVTCTDAVGNTGTGPSRTVTVSGPPTDYVAPIVGAVSPTFASTGYATTFQATYSDNIAISSCQLYVNGANAGDMGISGNFVSGTASKAYTFPSSGTYTVQVQCRDTVGNVGMGSAQTVSVTGSSTGSVSYGSLVKAACPPIVVASDHPCKAVYYYGSDAKRHAFPNEKVYFSWYTNFNNIVEVSDVTLASLPLGKNVSYRPGTRMVKFQTVPKVYVVSRFGVLRWVTSESVAQSLYGWNWAAQVDDIPESFYTNYNFGADITAIGQYVPSVEQSQVPTIDQNL